MKNNITPKQYTAVDMLDMDWKNVGGVRNA